MGLQKSGTTLMAAAVAAALDVGYQPEAVFRCCEAACAADPSEHEATFNFYPHNLVFAGNMRSYFERCSSLLLNETTGAAIGVLKADDMLPLSAELASYARAERLNLRSVFVVRHPLATIRSLQAWIKSRHHEWLGIAGVEPLAQMWRRAARVRLDAPAGTFAATLRLEDFLAAPSEAMGTLLRTALPETALPAGWKERVQAVFGVQYQPRGDYTHAAAVNATYSDAELATVLRVCGAEMAEFNYSMADVFESDHTLQAAQRRRLDVELSAGPASPQAPTRPAAADASSAGGTVAPRVTVARMPPRHKTRRLVPRHARASDREAALLP